MTSTGKVALGVGVLALGAGAIYIAYQHRQALLAQQGAIAPVPVGITSIYSLAGSAATAGGMRASSASMVGGVPLQLPPPGPLPQSSSSAQLTAAFAASAAANANAMPAIGAVTAPTVEARAGRGHF